MDFPKNLKYTKTDEWILIDGDVATLGISDFAQNQLSDIVYIEYLVEPDDAVKANSAIATLESVKAAADVNCPLAGKVVEVNDGLADVPESINTTPYEAWMVKIELSGTAGVDSLMDAAAYEKYCQEREH